MAYAPGFLGDVFISYAHRDNESGWVTELKSNLLSRLNFDLGGGVEVWFDSDRLRTGDIFKQDIRDQLNSTMIFVAIVSRAYLKSDFCIPQELNYFLDAFGRDVIQLQIQKLAAGDDPPLTDAIYGHLYDPSSNLPLRGTALDASLHQTVAAIREKLEAARAACPKVYLAQPSTDLLKVASQQLALALHQERLAVLPTQVVTLRTRANRIREWIEDAALSLHIESTDPLAISQLNIARATGLPMLVLPAAPRQAELPAIVTRAKSLLDQVTRRHEIYFIYDYYSDNACAAPITHQLTAAQSDRQIALPQPGESYHRKKLLESDGVVLFRRDAPITWFHSHREKLQQMKALRSGSVPKIAYYTALPGDTDHLSIDERPDCFEITRTGSPNAADLLPFLNSLGPTSASASTTAGGGPL